MKHSLRDRVNMVFYSINLRKYFTKTEALMVLELLRQYQKTDCEEKMRISDLALFMDDYLKSREK